jgi:hypothetical protein
MNEMIKRKNGTEVVVQVEIHSTSSGAGSESDESFVHNSKMPKQKMIMNEEHNSLERKVEKVEQENHSNYIQKDDGIHKYQSVFKSSNNNNVHGSSKNTNVGQKPYSVNEKNTVINNHEDDAKENHDYEDIYQIREEAYFIEHKEHRVSF